MSKIQLVYTWAFRISTSVTLLKIHIQLKWMYRYYNIYIRIKCTNHISNLILEKKQLYLLSTNEGIQIKTFCNYMCALVILLNVIQCTFIAAKVSKIYYRSVCYRDVEIFITWMLWLHWKHGIGNDIILEHCNVFPLIM